MTETEELIKAALAKQADRAPHAGQIRFALESPRRRRAPGLIAVIVGILVVSGISVPTVLLQSKPTPAPPPPTLENGIPMLFKPTYLPAGYVEVGREGSENDFQGRSYNRSLDQTGETAIVLSVFGPNSPSHSSCQTPPPPLPNSARLSKYWVIDRWCVELRTPLSVSVAERDKIAASVRPDGNAVMKSPLRFGWLPDYLRTKTLDIRQGPGIDRPGAMLQVRGSDPQGPNLTVTLGQPNAPWQVTGQDRDNDPFVRKELSEGRVLWVQFFHVKKGLTAQQQDQIVQGIELQPVDFSWLGK